MVDLVNSFLANKAALPANCQVCKISGKVLKSLKYERPKTCLPDGKQTFGLSY